MTDQILRIKVDGEEAKKMGINYLTGEACALSMRILCEINKDMLKRYIDFTGLRIDPSGIPQSHYNDHSKYAVFLTWNTIKNLMIITLAEEHETITEVNEKDNGITWLYAGNRDDINARFKEFKHAYGFYNAESGEYIKGECYDIGRSYSYGTNPRRGNSNVHAMTGIAH